jgi:hypothetical protein
MENDMSITNAGLRSAPIRKLLAWLETQIKITRDVISVIEIEWPPPNFAADQEKALTHLREYAEAMEKGYKAASTELALIYNPQNDKTKKDSTYNVIRDYYATHEGPIRAYMILAWIDETKREWNTATKVNTEKNRLRMLNMAMANMVNNAELVRVGNRAGLYNKPDHNARLTNYTT